MTTPIEVIADFRKRQKFNHWLPVYDAIIELHGRVASIEKQCLSERIDHLRNVICDQLPPRSADEPEAVPVPGESASDGESLPQWALKEADRVMHIVADCVGCMYGSHEVAIVTKALVAARHAALEDVATWADAQAANMAGRSRWPAQSAYLDIAERCRNAKIMPDHAPTSSPATPVGQ